MSDIHGNSWIKNLEVTGPIQDIMDFVEELSQNYDRRAHAIHVEYQKDVEEILACYKNERKEFEEISNKQQKYINALQTELENLQAAYKTMQGEYNKSKTKLKATQHELAEITKSFKNTAELIILTKDRITHTNQQLKKELEPNIKNKTNHFKNAYDFLQKGITERLSKTAIVNNKQEPAITEHVDDLDSLDTPIITHTKVEPKITDSEEVESNTSNN